MSWPENLAGGLAAAGLASLLPAVANGPPQASTHTVRVAAGEHPAVRGLAAYFMATKEFTLEGVLPLSGMKPGAEVLLLVVGGPEADRPQPLLVVHQYGKGRVAVVGATGTWAWALEHAARGGTELHQRFWGQLVRWVAGRKDAEEAARVVLSRRVLDAGEELSLRLAGTAARDVPVTITGPETAVDLVLTGPANRKEASFRSDRLGRYAVNDTINGTENTTVFFVEANPVEREKLKPETDALYELARVTGGGLVQLPELDELPRRIVRSFPGALKEVEETPEKNPLLFLIFAGAAFLEWLLRRRFLTV